MTETNPASTIPEGASHHTDDETIRRHFLQLVQSLSFYGEHAGEEVTLAGMPPLPSGEAPMLSAWSRGTVHLSQPDVVRLRNYCNRWLDAVNLWNVSYYIPVGGTVTPKLERLPVCQECCFKLRGLEETPSGPVPDMVEMHGAHERCLPSAWEFLLEDSFWCYLCINIASPVSWMDLWAFSAMGDPREVVVGP